MKKIFTILTLSLLVGSMATHKSKAQGLWLVDGTELIVPGGDGTLDTDEVITYYLLNRHRDYMQTSDPKFVITDRKARAMFTIGGFVNFRTAYDFNDVNPNMDFVTSVIPLSSNLGNAQRALMDASTSRLYFESIFRTDSGLPLTTYIETDFRGPGNSLRLRQAYIGYAGFKFGQTTSAFTDINSSFRTIDFEGPNAYSYMRNLVAQYSVEWDSGLGMGVGLEYPSVAAEYNSYTSPIYQRVPDIPVYLNYKWGNMQDPSHIRLAAIMRNMFYTDNHNNVNIDKIGWGVQLSSKMAFGDWGRFYGQFLYGDGISQYVQDLAGMPYDMVASQATPGNMLAVPTMAWYAGMEIDLCENMPMNIGYSQVRVYNRDNYMQPDDYKLGQYLVANVFYDINHFWSVGVEYIYGTKHTMVDDFGRSNRIQAAIQFNF